eukprot:12764898-Alexandrium_andersonii.AAC.1
MEHLHALAAIVHVDTVSVERSHARNRRRVFGRDQHTHRMAFDEMSAWQTMAASSPAFKQVSHCKPCRKQRPRPSSSSAPVGAPSKRQRRTGPWRAA